MDRRKLIVTSAPAAGGFGIGTTSDDSSRSSVVTGPVICVPFKLAWSSVALGRADGRADGLPEVLIPTALSLGEQP